MQSFEVEGVGLVPGVARITAVDEVSFHPDNPRVSDLDSLKASIVENGFYTLIVVWAKNGWILVGNHRMEAAIDLGMKSVPAFWADVDEETAERILAADNRTSDLSEFNYTVLAQHLLVLDRSKKGLRGTGFTPKALAAVMDSFEVPTIDDLVQKFGRPTESDFWPVLTIKAHPGDAFLLERHLDRFSDEWTGFKLLLDRWKEIYF